MDRPFRCLVTLVAVVAALFPLFATAPIAQEQPGVQRWAVKTGSDPAAPGIDLLPVETSVEELAGLPRPPGLPLHYRQGPWDTARYGPVESQCYRLTATLEAFNIQKDGDYHLVLRGETGAHMVAEIPLPKRGYVSSKSPWYGRIRTVRAKFDKRFRVKSQYTILKVAGGEVKVEIVGIGFFDFKHQMRDPAPNFVELHPVIRLNWLD